MAEPPKPVEVAIAEVFAARARHGDTDFLVTEIAAEVADRLNWIASAWYIGEAVKRVYGARRRRWAHGRALVYDFPHVDENGAPAPISTEREAA